MRGSHVTRGLLEPKNVGSVQKVGRPQKMSCVLRDKVMLSQEQCMSHCLIFESQSCGNSASLALTDRSVTIRVSDC